MLKKILLLSLFVGLLSGCEHSPSWAQHFSFLQPPPAVAERFDFDWLLAGAREVAPLQAFSTPSQIWLQFAPNQAIPAIFGVQNGQHTLLKYNQSEPYVLISGQWTHLVFKGGSLEASATHQPTQLTSALTTEPELELAPELELNLAEIAAPEIHSFAVDTESVIVPSLSKIPYGVEPKDQTLRQALKRWALRAGWSFDDQHWGVEIDLPIVSTAHFSPDFSESVAQLMRSTALGSRPLQACFYSNQVMRVISLTQSCNPADTSATFAKGSDYASHL